MFNLESGCDKKLLQLVNNGYDDTQGRVRVRVETGGNIAKTNTTGFSAFPAGYWKTTFDGYGQSANFWTSTPEDNKAWACFLAFSEEMLSSYTEDKKTAVSVRCVKN